MEQTVLVFDDAHKGEETLSIPALTFGPVRIGVGVVQCVLQEAETASIIKRSEIAISARRKETLLELSNGDKIIVTDRVGLDLPAGADGLLVRQANGRLFWKHHRVLKEFSEAAEKQGWVAFLSSRAKAWGPAFRYKTEKPNADGSVSKGNEGLRPPQVGALHAIGAHWSLSTQPATIVMPTGTGKTETMLATMAAYDCGKIVVIVPTDALRSQTARKFLTFGWLKKFGVINPEAPNPVVGLVAKRPAKVEDLAFLERCDVVIATMAALQQGRPDRDDADGSEDEEEQETGAIEADGGGALSFNLAVEIAKSANLLIVDEAHHVPAKGWSAFREAFRERKVLQFTATPFRRDGRLVDGAIIYSYPLRKAQEEKYFKPIVFLPVYEPAHAKADAAIAEVAVARLQEDIGKGLNHLMMVRCQTIARAKAVHGIYAKLAPEFSPLLLHSKSGGANAQIEELRVRKSRIVVCVNMLGEGFDLPELKIAALHDMHKSLAVLLQFAGRFTRSSAEKIGDAAVIANIAEPSVTSALERLYSEDADWNHLLSELSSEAAKDHARLIEFLSKAKPLVGEEDDSDTEISRRLLRPTLSTLTYEAGKFRPKNFPEGLPEGMVAYRAWLHEENTLFFVTRSQPILKWCRSKSVRDTVWHLFVLHYDKKRGLLYLSSSDHSSDFAYLAKAVGASALISGEIIFRTLGRIARLLFQNIGLKKYGRRNLSYAMYTGAQVAEALGLTEKGGSTKANLSGTGWENGKQVSIGCSAKGRVWSRDKGTIPEFIEWSRGIGEKLRDDMIKQEHLLASVLIPTEVTTLPAAELLCMDWPLELLRESEERVGFRVGASEHTILTCDIEFVSMDRGANTVDFVLVEARAGELGKFRFKLGGPNTFEVTQVGGQRISIEVGKIDQPLEEYFSDRPPLFRFVDLTELDANLHIKPQNPQELKLPDSSFEPWKWGRVDFKKESMWKDGERRDDSIQAHAAKFFIDGSFDVVFDDDAANEAADLVCLKAEKDRIRIVLVHCKFAGGKTAGERVKDVVEVCSQAVRSAKWNARFQHLGAHIRRREEELKTAARTTRFLAGDAAAVANLVKMSRLQPAICEIIIVQPGLSQKNATADQRQVLAAAMTYLKETINVDMGIVCSE